MPDHESWKFILEGIALPLVGFFGFTGLSFVEVSVSLTFNEGNILTARILLQNKLELSVSFTQLLTALLFSDSVTIVITFIVFSLPNIIQVIRYSWSKTSSFNQS